MRRLALRSQQIPILAISALWFAFHAQWLTIPVTIVQTQVKYIVGGDAPGIEATTGFILAGGAFVALVAAPFAGALSDRIASAAGRRRPFLIQGILASCVALVLFALPGPGDSLFAFALAYLNLQFWWNWAAGPYAGLIPDIVPPGQQATASGWMNVLIILGMIVGNVLVILCYAPERIAILIGLFIGLNLLCLWITLAWTDEPPSPRRARGPGEAAFLRSFYLSPRDHPDFYWVLATRLFSNLGVWSTLGFLVFYLQAIFGMSPTEASRFMGMLLGGGAALSVPASLVGIRLADRHGLVRIVKLTSWIMAGTTFCYVLIALNPSVVMILATVAVFSIASGAYGAADWYLAMKVLPKGQDAGKDFGIWHVCMVLPQIIAPATIGVLISLVKTRVSPSAAYELAFAIGTFWFLLAAVFVGRVRLAPSPAQPGRVGEAAPATPPP
jgi:Na+/melibiose symporter-like transporter